MSSGDEGDESGSPPEGFPGTVEEWSELSDEQKRIERFVHTPEEDRDPAILVPEGVRQNGDGSDCLPGEDPRTDDGVPASTCKEIRREMSEALTAREVVENYQDLHTSKVMRHAYGECNHSVEVPATASPQIGPDECHAMRDDYRESNSVAEIAKTWSRSENTVTRHIFGRCSHDSRPRQTPPSALSPNECERLRRTFLGNEKVGVREVACAMRLRVEVAATHIFGFCSHAETEVEEPRADPEGVGPWDGRDV